MNRKIVTISVCVCSFFVSFVKYESEEYDRNESAITTFELLENQNGLSVSAEDLSFGTHELTKEDLKVEAQESMAISIAELSGKKPGWTLKAKLDSFKDKQNSIDNAELFFPVVIPKSEIEGLPMGIEPDVFKDDTSFLDNQNGKIVHVSSDSIKLAEAKDGKGFGKWVLPYEDDKKIQLRVPAGQKEGTYIAELVYTIEEGPIP